MRILHVIGEIDFSGGEDQLAHLLAHLVAVGHESRLLFRPGALFETTARELGLPFETLRMRSGLDPLAVLSVRRRVRAAGPDLVHLADARAHKLGALATRGRYAPMVVTRRVNKPLRRGRFTRWLYAGAVAAVVAVSESVRATVLAAGVPAERVHVVPDGIDPDRYADLGPRRRAARRALDLPQDALVCLCAARLDPRKGQIHLVRAFGTLAARHPNAHLLLAGEGPERAALEREARMLGLEPRVRMPGRVDILDALAASDLACMPSLNEGLSVFALEAQAAGLPIVASRAGGLTESVAEGESGWLTAPGDEPGLAAALEHLVSDDALRQRMGTLGRARVAERFSLRRMVEETTRLYERIAGPLR